MFHVKHEDTSMKQKIFSFCNQKGGVGKTTSVINISAYLASKGFKTLVIDMDAQANLTSGLGVEKPEIESTTYQLLVDNSDPAELVKPTNFENLFLIASNAHLAGVELELVSKIGREYAMRNQLDKLKENFDFIFIDCPPSLGLATVNALTASDYLIIPLQCEYYALEGLGQLLNTFQLIQKNLNQKLQIGGVLLTMADFRTNLTQQVIEEVRGHFERQNVFESVIPRSVKLSEAPSFGKPAIFYDTTSRGSKCYVEAGEEFIRKFAEESSKEVPVENEPTHEKEPENKEAIS